MFVDDVNDYAQRDTFGDDYVWLIDKEHSIDEDIDWAPNPFEYKMIHSFKMPYQLQDKYPNGRRWYKTSTRQLERCRT